MGYRVTRRPAIDHPTVGTKGATEKVQKGALGRRRKTTDYPTKSKSGRKTIPSPFAADKRQGRGEQRSKTGNKPP